MNVGDLEKIGITEDINFFSSKFFDFLKDREEEFLKIISKYEHKFNNKRDSEFFGKDGNHEVRLWMGEVLFEYLVKDSDISNVFDFSDKLTKLVLPKKVIDVSFQGLVNSYIDKKHHFKVWQVRDLFGKHNMNYMMSRYVLTHSISDLSKPAKRVIRDYGYTKGNSLYSKLNAKQLNKYLSELKGELVGDEMIETSVVESLVVNNLNVNNDSSKPIILLNSSIETSDNFQENGLVAKIETFYKNYKLKNNDFAEEFDDVEKVVSYLDRKYRPVDSAFVRFLRSKEGKSLLFHNGNPNNRLVNRIHKAKEDVMTYFSK